MHLIRPFDSLSCPLWSNEGELSVHALDNAGFIPEASFHSGHSGGLVFSCICSLQVTIAPLIIDRCNFHTRFLLCNVLSLQKSEEITSEVL